MEVKLYTINKRENSTQRPAGTGAAYECVLKRDTSVVNPVIIIDYSDQAQPTTHLYNYAYIAEFNRYYFIADQRCLRGLVWEYSLTCDILATYKGVISASTLYLTRCSASFDGNIIDHYYPVKTNYTVDVQTVITPWLHENLENININQGCFILGITGKPGAYAATAYGSVKYVALNKTNLNTLISYLMDSNTLVNGNVTIDGLSNEAIKSVIDPLSFIKSCQWCPMLYEGIDTTEQTGLSVWDWTAQGVHYKPMRQSPPYFSWSVSFTTIPNHPKIIRGTYLNTEPYTKRLMLIPPFGLIEVDTTLAAGVSQIVGRIFYDLITGMAILEVHYGQAISGPPAVRISAQVGVPIQLTQVYNDYIHAATGVAGGLIGGIASALTGNIAGALQGGISAIGSAVDAMRPIVTSLGGNGSFADLHGQARLYSIFYDVPDEDRAHVGRPLCQSVTIGNLAAGTYCLAMDGDVPISGTAGEQTRLKNYLEGGFYYE